MSRTPSPRPTNPAVTPKVSGSFPTPVKPRDEALGYPVLPSLPKDENPGYPVPSKMTTFQAAKDRTIPKISPKLAGQHNYAEWMLNLKLILRMHEIGDDYMIWDIVKGEYSEPGLPPAKKEKDVEGAHEAAHADINAKKEIREWSRANSFALFTMRTNCEAEPLSKLGLVESSNEAYKALVAHYEGKTITDIGTLIDQVMKMNFDDRATTIEEHIGEFERNWSFMRATITNGNFPDNLKTDGDWMKKMSQSDNFKAVILLNSFPGFYAPLIQTLRLNGNYTYGDIVRNLQSYIPGKQRVRNKLIGLPSHGTRPGPGSSADNAVILKTETKDMSKQCGYCQRVKKWRGFGHTEAECRTKVREAKKVEVKNEFEEDSDAGVKIGRIRTLYMIKSITSTKIGHYEFDTGAQVHTTNEL